MITLTQRKFYFSSKEFKDIGHSEMMRRCFALFNIDYECFEVDPIEYVDTEKGLCYYIVNVSRGD